MLPPTSSRLIASPSLAEIRLARNFSSHSRFEAMSETNDICSLSPTWRSGLVGSGVAEQLKDSAMKRMPRQVAATGEFIDQVIFAMYVKSKTTLKFPLRRPCEHARYGSQPLNTKDFPLPSILRKGVEVNETVIQ